MNGIVLATLALNEMEWLEKLYIQHRDWPGLVAWVFVEAADRVYAQTNPEMVTDKGLSVDGTSEFLMGLAHSDPRVKYVPFGFSDHKDPAQCKVAARQAYMDMAGYYEPEFVIVLDADEMYTRYNQSAVLRFMKKYPSIQGFTFKQRHIWHPPSISEEPLFKYEVVGGYWDVPHARFWRWKKGMKYTDNHNTPHGIIPMRFDTRPDQPQCIHLGFASQVKGRVAKHRYYQARGEGKEGGRVGKMRQMYIDCRASFEGYQVGDVLPHGARVVPYYSNIPEVFR